MTEYLEVYRECIHEEIELLHPLEQAVVMILSARIHNS